MEMSFQRRIRRVAGSLGVDVAGKVLRMEGSAYAGWRILGADVEVSVPRSIGCATAKAALESAEGKMSNADE